jgi:hypothetical protein
VSQQLVPPPWTGGHELSHSESVVQEPQVAPPLELPLEPLLLPLPPLLPLLPLELLLWPPELLLLSPPELLLLSPPELLPLLVSEPPSWVTPASSVPKS